MNEAHIAIYCVLSVLFVCIDAHIARKSFMQSGEVGHYLALSGIAASIVTFSYLISVITESYPRMSIASSVYFLSIDWMLIFLVHFVMLITHAKEDEVNVRLRKAIRLYACFDTAVFIVNVFKEICISYVPQDTPIAHYAYDMKPLYIAHLLFTYCLVVVIIYVLFNKLVHTPLKYRNQYLFLLASIVLVVLVNAVFLYPLGDSIFSLLDLSVLGYSLGLYCMYWSAFEYREGYMIRSLSMTIFENIDQGIVLFDYAGELIMHNDMSERLLPHVSFPNAMKEEEFVSQCELPLENHLDNDAYSIQTEMGTERPTAMRCDYRRLRDADGTVTGNLFVFSDISNDTDMLTGFQHWEDFRKFAAENPWNFDHPTAVAIFDIIGLGEVNQTFGREVGDQRIRNLVKIMRTHMPKDTYYVRGYEAHLIAICPLHEESEIQPYVQEILAACGDTITYGLSSTADRARERAIVSSNNPLSKKITAYSRLQENRNIVQAVETASRSMQVKKLLDTNSHHSQTLTSLVRALQESDTDTEEHVKRTQKMGALLGARIGLNDAELSDLKLLCLLHDIGKIGIPLEILNKPGRLTDAEWKVLRSHAEKGYQIAMSSDELRPIARMILHHHEQWDGKGYPGGISGNSIPLLSRFIAVVDSYDAMVNTRAYRKALSPEQAKEEIRRCSGTQFDPFVADQFLLMLEENPELGLGEKTSDDVASMESPFAHLTEASGRPVTSFALNYTRYVLDIDDNIVEIDDYFERLTGYTHRDAIAGRMRQIDLIPPEDQTDYYVLISKQLSRNNSVYVEHNILRKDGAKVRVFCYGKRYYDSALKVFRNEIIVFDAAQAHIMPA